jgi:hypothetical protein
MSRRAKIALAILLLAVFAGALYMRSLRRRVSRLAGPPPAAEELARRAVIEPPISTPTDAPVMAKIFWGSENAPDRLEPVAVELPLSADPVQRSKQVLHTLVANPPSPDRRTLPADTTLLAIYILPDGTVIADFADMLATETPSGILSEQMAVDSIARTLEANVPVLHRLKILIHGQEAETLAGHVDLGGFFSLQPPAAPPGTPAKPAAAAPSGPAPNDKLTVPGSPGKLKP